MDIRSNKGLTLVEVVVAVAIMAIIIVPISLVFTTAYTSFIDESDKVAAQQGARDVLYGKGINSFGIMGDLERSDATSDLIKIGELIDINDPDKGGRSIRITETSKDVSGNTISVVKKYSYNGGVLFYDYDVNDSNQEVNFFLKEKSSNGHDVIVRNFLAQKVVKVTGSTDTDVIKITVTVTCGQSCDITLESSYRIPNIEG
jgi:prepilin-type N-terminal cleavage/methylation domain-containing protein